MPVTIRQLEWASGFLEGEGCFRRYNNRTGYEVTARQNDGEVLDKLQNLFGGHRSTIDTRSNKLSKRPTIECWSVTGPKARGVMMTLFSLMSRHRKDQIKRALA